MTKDDLFGPLVDLDDELKEYYEADRDIPCIRHPLVYSMFHTPHMNGMVNAQLRYKQAALAKAKDRGDYSSYIWLHERPFRLQAFLDVEQRMQSYAYWELAAKVWIDSENIRQVADRWEPVLLSERPDRHRMMQPDEREAYRALPHVVHVYQGHTDGRDDGWSWTTDRDKALWFANRFAVLERSQPRLSNAYVRKEDITAYLTRRGESEVLANPRHVVNINTRTLTKQETTQ